jgi:hypothetical protein
LWLRSSARLEVDLSFRISNSPLPEAILFEAKDNSDDNSGERKEGLDTLQYD